MTVEVKLGASNTFLGSRGNKFASAVTTNAFDAIAGKKRHYRIIGNGWDKNTLITK
jgi:hypothetical protein